MTTYFQIVVCPLSCQHGSRQLKLDKIKTNEEILNYLTERTRTLVIAYKNERRKMQYWDNDKECQFYQDHRYFFLQYDKQLNEIRKVLDFATGSMDAFESIFTSIP